MTRALRSAGRWPVLATLTLALLLLALAASAALAQVAPSVALEAVPPVRPGDEIVVTARGLPATADYQVRLETPDGAVEEQPFPVVGGVGRLALTVVAPGRHVVWLTGPDLEARFVVEVRADDAREATPAEDAPGESVPDVPAPTEPGPNDGAPGEAAPAESTPHDTAPAESMPGESAPADTPPAESAPPAATPPAAADVAPTPSAPAGAAAATEAPPAPAVQVVLVVEDDVVVARDASGEARWRFGFPAGSGTVGPAVVHLGRGYLAVGHQVLTLDLDRGTVTDRVATSGRIVDLRPVGTGLNVASEVGTPGRPRVVEARLEDGVLTPPAVFDPSATLFDALVLEARVADPVARLSADPTNPYLHLEAARAATTTADRTASLEAALANATTFYDLARLARAFVGGGDRDLADRAMTAAGADFAVRGYDPAMLTDPEVHERYGFPLRPLEAALARGDLADADVWAPWTYALSGPNLAGAGAALRSYASMLADRGMRTEAAAWRERAAERTSTSVSDVVERAAVAVGHAGGPAALALLVALAALHLTLIAKYARARAVAVRQALEAGRRVPAWPWTRTLRYVGFTEKLVTIAVLASVVVVAALAGWVQRSEPAMALVTAGHLEAPALVTQVIDVAGDPESAAWVAAYRADRAGDAAAARAALSEAAPAADAARAALGRGDAVPTPSPATLRASIAGTWWQAIWDVFRDPRRLLGDAARVAGVPSWAWPALVVLFALVVLLHVLALFVPRPALARHAPRPIGYHLLALLLPGSGQADELYGGLLLVPWAIFGIDVVVQLFGGATLLGVSFRAGLVVLGVLYALNVVAWAVEFASVRRRMRALRERQPELARAFGMTPLEPRTVEDARP